VAGCPSRATRSFTHYTETARGCCGRHDSPIASLAYRSGACLFTSKPSSQVTTTPWIGCEDLS
jgi:hypothetical protein